MPFSTMQVENNFFPLQAPHLPFPPPSFRLAAPVTAAALKSFSGSQRSEPIFCPRPPGHIGMYVKKRVCLKVHVSK